MQWSLRTTAPEARLRQVKHSFSAAQDIAYFEAEENRLIEGHPFLGDLPDRSPVAKVSRTLAKLRNDSLSQIENEVLALPELERARQVTQV